MLGFKGSSGGTTELEQFLQSRQSEGTVESRGEFTLAREEALAKLAQFQLPFESAWIVKLVQAIVAGGCRSPIKVELLTTSVRFVFGTPGFSLDEVEGGFYNPQLSPHRSLRHLLSGLWAVGLRNKWGFQVALPGQSTTLIWDGQTLNRVATKEKRDSVCITVAPQKQKSLLGWASGVATSGRRNAELLMTLARNCYACPAPLVVDGRRVDGLQRASNYTESDALIDHSPTPSSVLPLFIGDAKAQLPPLGVPPGTFLELPKSVEGNPKQVGPSNEWETASRFKIKATTPFEQATLPFLLSIHLRLAGSSKSRYWAESSGPSTVFWVLDGAVLAQEPLLRGRYACPVTCFLSAEGLETDLSTLDLRQSGERSQRLSLAKEALFPALLPLESISFDEMVRRGVITSRVAGGSLVALGLFSLYATVPIGLILGAIGGGLYYFAGSKERGRVATIQRAVGDLRREMGREVGPG